MSYIRWWLRHLQGSALLVLGGGLALTGLSLTHYYGSPIPLALTVVGAPMTVAGRLWEKRADRRFTVEHSAE